MYKIEGMSFGAWQFHLYFGYTGVWWEFGGDSTDERIDSRQRTGWRISEVLLQLRLPTVHLQVTTLGNIILYIFSLCNYDAFQ